MWICNTFISCLDYCSCFLRSFPTSPTATHQLRFYLSTLGLFQYLKCFFPNLKIADSLSSYTFSLRPCSYYLKLQFDTYLSCSYFSLYHLQIYCVFYYFLCSLFTGSPANIHILNRSGFVLFTDVSQTLEPLWFNLTLL